MINYALFSVLCMTRTGRGGGGGGGGGDHLPDVGGKGPLWVGKYTTFDLKIQHFKDKNTPLFDQKTPLFGQKTSPFWSKTQYFKGKSGHFSPEKVVISHRKVVISHPEVTSVEGPLVNRSDKSGRE